MFTLTAAPTTRTYVLSVGVQEELHWQCSHRCGSVNTFISRTTRRLVRMHDIQVPTSSRELPRAFFKDRIKHCHMERAHCRDFNQMAQNGLLPAMLSGCEQICLPSEVHPMWFEGMQQSQHNALYQMQIPLWRIIRQRSLSETNNYD